MQVKQRLLKGLWLLGLYLYYFVFLWVITITVVDTPEALAVNREHGVGPPSYFALMFLLLSGIGPVFVIFMPLLSFWLLNKAKAKSPRLFQAALSIHVILFVVFALRAL
ncbi:hypothetical protein [Paenibacillus turpanensis]|uniref:hypothetical protein n=1 Tax=Paenibacillus turpanensis TaxID=2689078 RepID=UPI00140921F2|nr:hypothetical protein [Paenibacillus turpanensis]